MWEQLLQSAGTLAGLSGAVDNDTLCSHLSKNVNAYASQAFTHALDDRVRLFCERMARTDLPYSEVDLKGAVQDSLLSSVFKGMTRSRKALYTAKQHYIPRVLLRNWAQVPLEGRGASGPIRLSVRKMSTKDGSYTNATVTDSAFIWADHHSQQVERSYGKLEEHYGLYSVRDELLDGSIDSLICMVAFTVMQMVRQGDTPPTTINELAIAYEKAVNNMKGVYAQFVYSPNEHPLPVGKMTVFPVDGGGAFMQPLTKNVAIIVSDIPVSERTVSDVKERWEKAVSKTLQTSSELIVLA